MDAPYQDESDVDEEEDNFQDSTRSGRDAVIFLVEISPEMFEKSGDEDKSNVHLALLCARSMNVNKITSSSSDYVGVVLFDSAGGGSGGAAHVLQEPALPGADRVLELDVIIDGDMSEFRKKVETSGNCSLSDALHECLTLFKLTEKTHKLQSKRIMLFTCRDRPPGVVSDAVRRRVFQKVEDLRGNDMLIDLFPLGRDFNMDAFYSEVLFSETSDEPPPTAVVSDKLEELLTRVRQKSHKKRALGKIPFVLGDGVKMTVGVYNLYRPTAKPSSVHLDATTNEPVESRSAEVRTDTGQTLLRSEINWCMNYGGRDIALTSDEKRELRTICEPGLVLLGFQPASVLEPPQHVQPASFIYPEETWVKGSRQLFAALLRRCSERGVVALCRLVGRRNDTPHLVVLKPQEERCDDAGVQLMPPGFHVIYLPFADDVRQLSLPASNRASQEQIDAARAVVTKLRFKYAPEKIENPVLQKHWMNIEAIALGQDEPEEFVDYTAPDVERIRKKAGAQIEAFKQLVFPDGYDPAGGAAPPRAKRPKTADSEDVDVAALAREKKVHSLKVPELKAFLQSVGAGVSGKKADLVSAVYAHFERK